MGRLLGSIILFVCTFAFFFFAGVPVRAAEPIRIAYSSVNPHALLAWIAEKRGLYAKYGLSSMLVYVPGGVGIDSSAGFRRHRLGSVDRPSGRYRQSERRGCRLYRYDR
ncbi:MAG TPA: hypothetical protein VEG60_03925 [Candidatus Binatia bacterium]|nr:hypothetical protein [Candidatus Binatia bacterium]